MDGMNPDSADEDDAARAFEALREEVAALRRGVELVYRQGQQSTTAAPGAPDYSPTLGKMEQALQAIAGRLEAIEHQPALTLTPATFRAEIDTVARVVAGTVSLPFVNAVHQVQRTARDLEALAGRVHERRAQRMWVLTTGALGLLVGVGLWSLRLFQQRFVMPVGQESHLYQHPRNVPLGQDIQVSLPSRMRNHSHIVVQIVDHGVLQRDSRDSAIGTISAVFS
jgi:hypothetical protein